MVGTVFEAYLNHFNLILKPDDVWIAITTAFARYIGAKNKVLRSKFVTHVGKMKLSAFDPKSTLANCDWQFMVNTLCKGIEQNTKSDVRKWFECDFSTTDANDKLIS